jgi:hypothetical protein
MNPILATGLAVIGAVIFEAMSTLSGYSGFATTFGRFFVFGMLVVGFQMPKVRR